MEPVEVAHGNRRLALASRRSVLAVAGGRAGLAWERPACLIVEESGRRRRLPVPDLTRRIQWSLLGIGLAAGLALRLSARRGRRPKGRKLR